MPGPALPAFLGEVSWEIDRQQAVFDWVENVANDELFPDHAAPFHDRRFRVTKAEAGYADRLPISGPLGIAPGRNRGGLRPTGRFGTAYGRRPVSWTLFTKLVLGL